MRNTLIMTAFIFYVGLTGCQPEQAVVKRSQMLMGTLVFVTAVAADEETAQRAAAAGLVEIRRLEELLSTWIPSSEVSRVNAAAGSDPVQVSPETLALIKRAVEMGKLTEGGFNVAIGPAVEAWGIPEEPRVPTKAVLEQVRPLLDLSQVRLDEGASTVFLAQPGMKIDIGGIGKGFAADYAVEIMQSVGATAGVVALSGDIKTFGHMPDGKRFMFGVQHPRQEGALLGQLELENEAISTAGDYQRFFVKDGIRYHHILDPKSLHPARQCQSVTVVASEGVLADGLDTGLFVQGPERGMAVVERLPGVEAIIVDGAGRLLVSSGLKGRLMTDRTLELVPGAER